jgi:hypothetical protein
MKPGQESVRPGAQSAVAWALKRWPFILLGVVGLYLLVKAEIARPSIWPVVVGIAFILGLAGILFPFQAFGEVGYVQISSPQLEDRIRARYQSEINELSLLGFSYRFSEGQTFPIINLVMIFPAIVLLVMLCKREVVVLHRGRAFLIGHAIYGSADNSTFGHPSGLGILFHTAFLYGSILISTNYESKNSPGGRFERHSYKGASIRDTWVAHQRSVETKVANGAQIDRDMSFKAYVGINT